MSRLVKVRNNKDLWSYSILYVHLAVQLLSGGQSCLCVTMVGLDVLQTWFQQFAGISGSCSSDILWTENWSEKYSVQERLPVCSTSLVLYGECLIRSYSWLSVRCIRTLIGVYDDSGEELLTHQIVWV